MRWLHEHGAISNLADYLALPVPVLEDARLLMDAEASAKKSAEARNRPKGGRRGLNR